jgi:endogenous inhibitor of DNA gyrase (YacG/DUF329 family)
MTLDDVHLDGNAAAGQLAEVFSTEMTTAIATCATCGTAGALGTTRAYVGGPGTVLRCATCGAVVVRLARSPRCLMIDMAGVRRLELPSASALG